MLIIYNLIQITFHMHKLYGIAYQRILKYFNKERITLQNVKQILKQKNIQPTGQIIFHRLPRQDCKDFVKTPCPISSAQQTKSEIVQISKRLRSEFKALETKVCNRCPFRDQCAKKYIEPAFASEDTTKDLIVFMSKLAQYPQTDYVTFKTWNGGYKIADSVLSMLQDLSTGGHALKQFQKLRGEQIEKSDQVKKNSQQLKKNVQQTIRQARKQRVPVSQSHVRVTTQTFEQISLGKMDKFTKKIDGQEDEDEGHKKRNSRAKPSKQEFGEEDLEDDIQDDAEQSGQKSFKKYNKTDNFRDNREGYKGRQSKFDGQRGGYNKFDRPRSEGYQKRQGYNNNNDYKPRNYENKDRPERTWQRDDKRGQGGDRAERGGYKGNSSFNRYNNQDNDGKKQAYGNRPSRYNNQQAGNTGERRGGYQNDRNFNKPDYRNNSNSNNDRSERYGQRNFKQRQGKYQRDQPERRNNFENDSQSDPRIKRFSKSTNPYEKKGGDFIMNDLPRGQRTDRVDRTQRADRTQRTEKKYNIKQAQFTKFERIPDELRAPQAPRQARQTPKVDVEQPKEQRKGRRVKAPTIIVE